MDKKLILPGQDSFCDFYPGSVVLVSAVDATGKADICAVGAWAIVNGKPTMYGIAMCARSNNQGSWKRYTTTCIEQTGEFVINIPHSRLADAVNICGTVTLTKEPNADKFALAKLTRRPAHVVRAPLIEECPVNIECKVHSVVALPTHDWIIGQPVAYHQAKGELKWCELPDFSA
jgi:flavin reductase (DIM6/NTAB) family NADH-FMN oxidoreductase RutF